MPASQKKYRTSSVSPLRQSQRLVKKESQLKITSLIPAKRSKSQVNNLEVSENKKIKLETTECLNNNTSNKNISLDDKKNNDKNEIHEKKQICSKNTSKINKKKGITGKHKKDELKKNGNADRPTTKKAVNTKDTRLNKKVQEIKKTANLEKCTICRQHLNNSDIIYYQGHPQYSVEEFTALTDEKLVFASGDSADIMERPITNIAGFSIYDEHGHLCPIDGGLVESDVKIYMSGYLKSICSDSADIDEESVPVKDCGPIKNWYIHGFGGGVQQCITLSTELGEYNLLKPSVEYKPLMNNLYEKIGLCKVIVEYIGEYHYLQPTYEDLLETVRQHTVPDLDDMKISEEMLHKHAQFVCNQVASFEANGDNKPLITLPCMRELIKLGKRKSRAEIDYKKMDKKGLTKATTTPLVQETFESFFSNQLDKTNHESILRKEKCGMCEACQLPDCGECDACRAMCKFGGLGRSKRTCARRRCPNMAVQQPDDSAPKKDTVPVQMDTKSCKKIKWIGEPVKVDAKSVYYERVAIDGVEFSLGDYVMVAARLSNVPALVSRIIYMWKDVNTKKEYFHGQLFIRSTYTVLGEVGLTREVFLDDRCYNGIPLSSILRKAYVERRDPPKDWFELGGKEVDEELFEDDGKTYFYRKFYERFTARFEDLPVDPECPNPLRKHRSCPSCERKMILYASCIPKIVGLLPVNTSAVPHTNRFEWTSVKWRGNEYTKGCGVFLRPGTFEFQNDIDENLSNKIMKLNYKQLKLYIKKMKLSDRKKKLREWKKKLKKVDENVYPEYYRKRDSNLRGSNVNTRPPFCVGHVVAVTSTEEGPLVAPQTMYLRVNVLYRPENTTRKFPHREDLNVVYWSEEIVEIRFAEVTGLCNLVYVDNIPQQDSIHEWLEMDPSRMYFRQSFDQASGKFGGVPQHAKLVGRVNQDGRKNKGKGKGKSSKPSESSVSKTQEISVRPLRTLDVFAGCGGLSEGLHRSGVAECEWAVENLEAAADAYSLNNRNCTVFKQDCNALLKAVLAGATHSADGLRLPRRGEVELLVGGPPCQGFSGMNRFNSRESAKFKNSLVATFLAFCDYYRPKYFILENVRNFVAFKKGMVLKLTLRALLAMGYQCTFGVLQAGHYGVPQTRRRLIVLAAAPGQRLPLYPEPTHVFSQRVCWLSTMIDKKGFMTNIRWHNSAPRRTCTIKDAMSDLPEICNGANKMEIKYGSRPDTYFQRLARSRDDSAELRDHVCKNMAPLAQARVARIPTEPGSDWRDLPNTSVKLSDGTKCKVLQYRYEDKKNGRSPTGALRGVCACAAGGACSPADKQENTLIPWCLPHTANRHNNWAGLYGRISWDGYFSTTVTDPEPMGKQGCVLHPKQHRLVSVRECARSQGFRDTYLFAGSVQDKHRQIGNAVPPPLGAALGREIKKCLSALK